MKDINDFMPKISNMRWGALLNWKASMAEVKEIDRMMPHDKRWHTIFQDENSTHIDNRIIRKRTAESMT